VIWVLLGILTLLGILAYCCAWLVWEIRDDRERLDELEQHVDHLIDEQFRRIVRKQ